MDAQPSSKRFEIAIGAATTGGISLDNELRLLKGALLYGDHVTIHSPTLSMLVMMAGLGELAEDDRLEFLRQVVPSLSPDTAPQVLAFLEVYNDLRRKKRRSPQEIITVEKVRRVLDKSWGEVRPRIDDMLTSSGADELVPAIDAGLLDIDPLVTGDQFDMALFLQAFIDSLASLLTERDAYPLFDDFAGDLVRTRVAEGLIEPTRGSEVRGRQVSAATDFMSRLPAFPGASVSELLDIRSQLATPLIRFRAAMVSMSEHTRQSFYESGYRDEVEQLYVQEVAPALLEIQEALHANAYPRQFWSAATGDLKTILTGVITFGVTRATELPPLIDGGAAVLTAAAKAAWEKSREAHRVKEHQLYFLYRTQDILGD